MNWKIILIYLKNFWNFLFTPSPQWKFIKGYENIYEISELGDIYNVKEFKNVPTFFKNDGYECVALTDKKGKIKQHRVHRLVAQTFLDITDEKTRVIHKDGDKTNNSVSNLLWIKKNKKS